MRQQLKNRCITCDETSKGDFCSSKCAYAYNEKIEQQAKRQHKFTKNQQLSIKHAILLDGIYVI